MFSNNSINPDFRVSVVVALFNKFDYIAECLHSIEKSTENWCEIIIVDDGSTDGSFEIAEEFVKRCSRARIFRHSNNKNMGVSASRNLGICMSKGQYLAFLDADDVMLPNRFKKTLKILREYPVLDGVVEAVDLMFDKDSDADDWVFSRKILGADAAINTDKFLEALFDGRCLPQTASITVTKSLIEKVGMYNEGLRLSEDFHLWLRLMAVGNFKSLGFDHVVARYRRHSGNTWTPSAFDSFRDLDIIADVLGWAKLNRSVLNSGSESALRRAFVAKYDYSIDLARTIKNRSMGLRATWVLISAHPYAAFRRRFVKNLTFLLLKL